MRVTLEPSHSKTFCIPDICVHTFTERNIYARANPHFRIFLPRQLCILEVLLMGNLWRKEGRKKYPSPSKSLERLKSFDPCDV